MFTQRTLERLLGETKINEFTTALHKTLSCICQFKMKSLGKREEGIPEGILDLAVILNNENSSSKFWDATECIRKAMSKQSNGNINYFYNRVFRRRDSKIEEFYAKIGNFGKLLDQYANSSSTTALTINVGTIKNEFNNLINYLEQFSKNLQIATATYDLTDKAVLDYVKSASSPRATM